MGASRVIGLELVLLVVLSADILGLKDRGPERDRFLLSHEKLAIGVVRVQALG